MPTATLLSNPASSIPSLVADPETVVKSSSNSANSAIDANKSNLPELDMPVIKNSAAKGSIGKASKKASAGTGMNGKSLCKREWIAENPQGTEGEFAVHWAALGTAGEQQ
ncbi:hypothetical protein C0992_013016, partial [Termitomyces sp. T32_za158]